MSELFGGFLLGNASILTNVCLLPLYPGLIAFLAGTSRDDKARSVSGWLGLVVLTGVLTMMMGVGLVPFSLADLFWRGALPWLLPLIYALIIVLGLVMLAGYNPFNRLSSAQAPVFKNPFVTAYSYGLMLGADDAALHRTDHLERLFTGRRQRGRIGERFGLFSGLWARLWLAAGGLAPVRPSVAAQGRRAGSRRTTGC